MAKQGTVEQWQKSSALKDRAGQRFEWLCTAGKCKGRIAEQRRPCHRRAGHCRHCNVSYSSASLAAHSSRIARDSRAWHRNGSNAEARQRCKSRAKQEGAELSNPAPVTHCSERHSRVVIRMAKNRTALYGNSSTAVHGTAMYSILGNASVRQKRSGPSSNGMNRRASQCHAQQCKASNAEQARSVDSRAKEFQ